MTTSASTSTSPPAPIPTCLDLDSTAPAVVEWEVDDTTHYLSHPDPRSSNLTFESRFRDDASEGFFKLYIPAQLKGVECNTHILIPIHPHSIISIDLETFPTSPAAVQKKMNCSTTCLRFRLHRPIEVVVPIAATEPLHPKRKPSGDILDALHSLVRVTALSVYVPDKELPKAKAQAICEAVSQCRLKPLLRQDDMASLYGGSGGKVVSVSADSPPSYYELEPPPPMAPLDKPNGNKRRRPHDETSPDDADGRFDALWTELIKMRKERAHHEEQLQERIHQLEDRVIQLEKEKKDMREELDVLRHGHDNTTDAVEGVETNLLEVQQGLDDLNEQVNYINQNGLDSDVEERMTDTIMDRVLEEISTTTYNAKITLERQ